MLSLGSVQEDATIQFYFSAAAADGGEENFSATIEQADIPIYKDGTVMTLDASTITITGLATGLYEVEIDLSNDADFTAGSDYWVLLDASDETIDSQAVSAVLGHFSIESASAKAVREMQEYLYPTATLTTQTGVSDGSNINLTGLVDAQSQDDAFNGTVWAVRDGTDGRVEFVVVTDFTNTNLLASVQQFDGTDLTFTPASGDHAWMVATTYADVRTVAGTDQTAGDLAALITTVDTVVDNIDDGVIRGTAQTGTLSTTQATTDLTGYADTELVGRTITFTGGTADGQQSVINAYASASGLITFATITTAPVNGDTFRID